MKKQHLRNIALIHGEPDNPKLPAKSLDAILIVNAYHEMSHYQAMLARLKESIKPGARLVIVDNRPSRTLNRPRDSQTKNHVLSADLAANELDAAGFRIVDRDDYFIASPDSESLQWIIAAEVR